MNLAPQNQGWIIRCRDLTVIVSRLKRCWLCSVNLPRIGKQVQFTINANIPRQTAGNCSRFTKLYAYFAITEIRAITSPRSVSPLSLSCVCSVWGLPKLFSKSREKMGTAHERSRREIWPAAVPQNFRVICASSTQTAPTRAKLERKLRGGRSVRAKRRSDVEAEEIRKVIREDSERRRKRWRRSFRKAWDDSHAKLCAKCNELS